MNPLDEAIKDLSRILGIMDVGTADRPRKMAAIVVTIERIKSWRNLPAPTTDDHRGGSSSPRELDERQEDRKVGRAAERHAQALAKHLEGIANIVAIYCTPTEHEGLGGEPGCVSHLRKQENQNTTIGGHFEPVYNKARSRKVCRWCYDHMIVGQFPPIEACHIHHTQGARAAGIWLAKRQPQKKSA